MNTHRKRPAQIQDWKRIGNSLLRLFVEELDAAERDGGSVGRVSGAFNWNLELRLDQPTLVEGGQ